MSISMINIHVYMIQYLAYMYNMQHLESQKELFLDRNI